MLTEYSGLLACPLEFGQSIVIVGKTIDGAGKFHINIKSGKEDISDIGLHISVRFREDIIIRNSKINGEWSLEERDEFRDENSTPNPIIPGEFFVIAIVVGENKFHIAVNNRPFCTFPYRVQPQHLRYIEIREHVQVIKQVDHRTFFPHAWPPIQSTSPGKAFSNDCPILFTPGHVIVITARACDSSKGQFVIKFYQNDTQIELLHFNPRFGPWTVVVRNAMKPDLEFGTEERDGGFPFVLEQQFTLAIAFTDKQFLFAVDGNYFASFAYRTPDALGDMNGFKITERHGMHVYVTRVDHIQMPDPDCQGFEIYSRDDIDII